MTCRHCGASLEHTFVDLGTAPFSNAFLTEDMLADAEKWYPLKVLVCAQCFLVQTQGQLEPQEVFTHDYPYFSSYSESWVEHAKHYATKMQQRFTLDKSSLVVELGANDGYLLQWVKASGIPCYGIEPAAGVASAARGKGLDVITEFFSAKLARELAAKRGQADLIVANNVLAHVPNINDFAEGVSELLQSGGVATFEFPHLTRLVESKQFDTIYHEHFSYLSLTTLNRIFDTVGLRVFDVEELSTHGGSLRVYACRSDSPVHGDAARVESLLLQEERAGVSTLSYYEGFQRCAENAKSSFVRFLLDAKREGKSVLGYGAAAKGNTLLNFCGIRDDLISFVVDRNVVKQGMYLPGSRIPIQAPELLKEVRPDYVVILPWNLQKEIVDQIAFVRSWGGKVVIPIPEPTEV